MQKIKEFIPESIRNGSSRAWGWGKKMAWTLGITIVLVSVPMTIANQMDKLQMMNLIGAMKERKVEKISSDESKYEDLGFLSGDSEE